jgi:hypothetical protein
MLVLLLADFLSDRRHRLPKFAAGWPDRGLNSLESDVRLTATQEQAEALSSPRLSHSRIENFFRTQTSAIVRGKGEFRQISLSWRGCAGFGGA